MPMLAQKSKELLMYVHWAAELLGDDASIYTTSCIPTFYRHHEPPFSLKKSNCRFVKARQCSGHTPRQPQRHAAFDIQPTLEPLHALTASTNSSLIPLSKATSSRDSFTLSNTRSTFSLSSFGRQCFTS